MTTRGGKTLFMLAFDQRASFKEDLFGIKGRPTEQEAQRISDAKRLIFEGLQVAVEGGAPLSSAGLLVDEQFGAAVARSASQEGFTLAMPVEKSGQPEFGFEYGDAFAEHIEAFNPDFAKVLVRYNPDGNADLNSRQLARLATLSFWLRRNQRRLLLELLVLPEPAQLQQVGGSLDRYEQEIRPELTLRTIAESQAAGVEPDIWKVEGPDRRIDYESIVQQARAGGRQEVDCIILGGGAGADQVEDRLRLEAGVAGFTGFAIGRTIWRQPLEDWLAGRASRSNSRRMIADTYLGMVRAYQDTLESRIPAPSSVTTPGIDT